MVGRGYALSQLLESRAPKERTELRLPEQKALHRRCFVDHDAGQHAQLFESFEGQVLRLVDNQQHASAVALLRPHEVGYALQQGAPGRMRATRPQWVARRRHLMRMPIFATP